MPQHLALRHSKVNGLPLTLLLGFPVVGDRVEGGGAGGLRLVQLDLRRHVADFDLERSLQSHFQFGLVKAAFGAIEGVLLIEAPTVQAGVADLGAYGFERST